MEEMLARFCDNIVGRLHGPLTLRLILQPIVATTLAIRAGIGDARAGRPLYFWAMLSDPDRRRDLLRQGLKDIGKLFVAACILDLVYQVIALHHIYPLETLVVACVLAIIPYLMFRGLANRIARARAHRKPA